MKLRILLAALFLFPGFVSYAQTKQDREVSSFKSIEVSGAFKVFIRTGDKCALTVVADEDVLDDVKHSVSDGELEVKMDQKWWSSNDDDVELYITVKELADIDISGACILKSKNTLQGNAVMIEASGASKVFLDLSCNVLDLELSGASKLNLKGSCKKFNIDASGASAIYAADLQSEIVNLEASGACKAEVHATKYLDIDASGASKVRYKGNPKVSQETSGASSVSSM